MKLKLHLTSLSFVQITASEGRINDQKDYKKQATDDKTKEEDRFNASDAVYTLSAK